MEKLPEDMSKSMLPDGAHGQIRFRLKMLREGEIVPPYAMTKVGYVAGMEELSENESNYIEIMAKDRAARLAITYSRIEIQEVAD